jgi:hypothetical protein
VLSNCLGIRLAPSPLRDASGGARNVVFCGFPTWGRPLFICSPRWCRVRSRVCLWLLNRGREATTSRRPTARGCGAGHDTGGLPGFAASSAAATRMATAIAPAGRMRRPACRLSKRQPDDAIDQRRRQQTGLFGLIAQQAADAPPLNHLATRGRAPALNDRASSQILPPPHKTLPIVIKSPQFFCLTLHYAECMDYMRFE